MEMSNSSSAMLTSIYHADSGLISDKGDSQTLLFDAQQLKPGGYAPMPMFNGLNDTIPELSVKNDSLQKRTLLSVLYSNDIYAKIWKVASPALTRSKPPTLYPEYTKPSGTKYEYRELDFWTSGFFPGSLHLLLERERRLNHALWGHTDIPGASQTPHRMQLEFACKWWSVNLHSNAALATTHDLGFMIFPWASLAWELDHDSMAYDTIIRASRTLAARYVPQVKAIRSWDTCITKRYSFTDPAKDFLLIIDNMMNLNMLFWTAAELNDSGMYEIAVNHARTTQQHHIRTNHSTTHLVVFDPDTGAPKAHMTNQGYSDESSWTRGQAWAIAGFAQTFHWTRDASFLNTAQACADYFLENLPPSGVPPWDFGAPTDTAQPPDTSAAIIAAYGMLLIHEARLQRGEASTYLKSALHIVGAVASHHLNAPSKFVALHSVIDTVEHARVEDQVEVVVQDSDSGSPETILGGATINNYEFAPRRWADHGLVYADYYFLLLGNKLLEMGQVDILKEIMV